LLVLLLVALVSACDQPTRKSSEASTIRPPTVAPGSTTQARVASPTPFDASTLNYPATARAFVAALNEGRFGDAVALLDEHFAFGGDCDYKNRRIWNIDSFESARVWLQALIADHDSIQIAKFVEVTTREHALGLELIRTSTSIRESYAAGVVRPVVPMVMHFSLDGRHIQQITYAWTTPVSQFRDCG
jgi:hypothetical protein